jgi:hypothetical protein
VSSLLSPAQARAILREIDDARLQHRPTCIYADEPAGKAMACFLGESDNWRFQGVEPHKDLKPAAVYGLPVVPWEELHDLALIRADAEQQEGRAIIVVRGCVSCKRTFS